MSLRVVNASKIRTPPCLSFIFFFVFMHSTIIAEYVLFRGTQKMRRAKMGCFASAKQSHLFVTELLLQNVRQGPKCLYFLSLSPEVFLCFD